MCIECCQSCKQHSWNTRHDEAKYLNFFNLIAEGVQSVKPEVRVLRNQIPKAYVDYDLYYNLIPNEDPNAKTFDQLPRVGAFEVSYKGKLIFSKLLSCRWPHISKVANKCLGMIDAIENGEDPSEFFADPIKRSQGKNTSTQNTKSRTLRSSTSNGSRPSVTKNRFVTTNDHNRTKNSSQLSSPDKKKVENKPKASPGKGQKQENLKIQESHPPPKEQKVIQKAKEEVKAEMEEVDEEPEELNKEPSGSFGKHHDMHSDHSEEQHHSSHHEDEDEPAHMSHMDNKHPNMSTSSKIDPLKEESSVSQAKLRESIEKAHAEPEHRDHHENEEDEPAEPEDDGQNFQEEDHNKLEDDQIEPEDEQIEPEDFQNEQVDESAMAEKANSDVSRHSQEVPKQSLHQAHKQPPKEVEHHTKDHELVKEVMHDHHESIFKEHVDSDDHDIDSPKAKQVDRDEQDMDSPKPPIQDRDEQDVDSPKQAQVYKQSQDIYQNDPPKIEPKHEEKKEPKEEAPKLKESEKAKKIESKVEEHK